MITSWELNAMVLNIPSHFSTLIDAIMYYEGVRRNLLIQKLKETSHPQFCDYLATLDTKQGLMGDKSVEYVLRSIAFL